MYSSASFDDAKVYEDCLTDLQILIFIGDAGYVSAGLAGLCSKRGSVLIATPRKNMSKNGIDCIPVKAICKTVEIVFSELQNFGLEHLKWNLGLKVLMNESTNTLGIF